MAVHNHIKSSHLIFCCRMSSFHLFLESCQWMTFNFMKYPNKYILYLTGYFNLVMEGLALSTFKCSKLKIKILFYFHPQFPSFCIVTSNSFSKKENCQILNSNHIIVKSWSPIVQIFDSLLYHIKTLFSKKYGNCQHSKSSIKPKNHL